MWTLFAEEGNKKMKKKINFLLEIVIFDTPHINDWIEGRNFQTLIGSTRGKIVKLNRTPVF